MYDKKIPKSISITREAWKFAQRMARKTFRKSTSNWIEFAIREQYDRGVEANNDKA